MYHYSWPNHVLRYFLGVREMVQRLRALPENLCSVDSTYMKAHNMLTSCAFSSRVPDVLFWPPWALHAHGVHTFKQNAYAHKINKSQERDCHFKINKSNVLVLKKKIYLNISHYIVKLKFLLIRFRNIKEKARLTTQKQ